MHPIFSTILGSIQDTYAKAHAPAEQSLGHFEIDGVKIERVETVPTTDVRFFSQRQLARLDTPEARAELARRAAIVSQRGEA